MANLQIEGKVHGEIGCKRFYTKGIKVTSKCPECGLEVTYDGDTDGYFFMYPYMGEGAPRGPETLDFSHEIQVGDDMWEYHEWKVPVVIRVTIEPIEPA